VKDRDKEFDSRIRVDHERRLAWLPLELNSTPAITSDQEFVVHTIGLPVITMRSVSFNCQ